MTQQEFIDLLKQIENGTFIVTELTIGISEFEEERQEERLNDEQIILLVEALKKNSNITKLNLSCNDFGDDGAIALATVNTLKELNIYDTRVGTIGGKALAESSLQKLSGISFIYHEENRNQFLELINAFINNKTIIDLDFTYSYIPSEMIAQLISNNTTIKTLVLSKYLDDSAFQFIHTNTTLEALSLPESEITDKGVEYIATNARLKSLAISQSKITDIGAKLLSTHPSLKSLFIYDSNISFIGAQTFIGSNLDKFHLDTNLKQNIISWKECEYIKHAFNEARQLNNAQLINSSQQSKKNKFKEYSEDEQEGEHLGKKLKADYSGSSDSNNLLSIDLVGSLEFVEETP